MPMRSSPPWDWSPTPKAVSTARHGRTRPAHPSTSSCATERSRLGIACTGGAEIWHFHAGSPVELTISERSPGGAEARTATLGVDLDSAQRPQAVVPAGWWQHARTLGEWSLVGCTVAPPFTFDAFELAPGP